MTSLNSQPQTLTTSWFDKTHVVAIGIDDYKNGVRSLGKAVNDAVQIAEIVEELKPSEEVNYYFSLASKSNPNDEVEQKVKKLRGSRYSSTKEGFKELLSHLKETVGNNDRIILYFAGHAIALPFARLSKDNGNSTGSQLQVKLDDKPQGYLLFQDAVKGHSDTYMKMDELIELLREIQCRHGLIILDCCFAGTIEWSLLRDSSRQIGDDEVTPSILDRYITKDAWQILTSSSETQKTNEILSLEDQLEKNHSGNSPFVTTLRKALIDGEADSFDPKRGFVHANKLINYLRDQVEESAIEVDKLQTPCMFPFSLKHEQTAEFVFLLDGKKLNEIKSNLPKDPDISQIKNPYLGLKSYSPDNYHIFFGREDLIEKLLKHINENKFPLTVVLGASGSGKSSLVKAGLIGKIVKDKIETSWETFRPEKSPRSNLTDAVKKLQNNNGKKCLLVIDQFEEVETQCEDSNEKDLFWEELIKLLTADEVKVDVVLTLRSDLEMQLRRKFEAAFGEFSNQEKKASDYWDSARFDVPVIMEREKLEEVITKPASKSVVFFEDNKNPNGSNERTLVQQLSSEVTGMPGALPLLSVALNTMYETFKKRYLGSVHNGEPVKREITWKDYESLGGGVVGSLTKRANELYDELFDEDNAYAHTVRHIMLRMISLQGNGLMRRPVPDSELEYEDPKETERVKEVIKRFSEAILIVKNAEDREPYVEPAHDALVKNWEKLTDWFEEKRDDLLFREEITRAATNWNHRRKEGSYLYHRGEQVKGGQEQLERAENLKQDTGFFNKLETEYLNECRKLRNSEAKEQAESRSKTSLILFDSHQELDALVEAFRAGVITQRENLEGSTSSLTKNALRKIVYGIKEKNRLEEHLAPVISVSFSPDGEMLATGSQDGKVILWENNGQKIKSLEAHVAVVSSVAFSPDGRFIVTGSDDTTVKLWSIESDNAIQTIIPQTIIPQGIELNLSEIMSLLGEFGLDTQKIMSLLGEFGLDIQKIMPLLMGTLGIQEIVNLILCQINEIGIQEILSRLRQFNLGRQEIQSLMSRLGLGEQFLSFLQNTPIGCVAFSPDSKFLAIANDDGYVLLYEFDSNAGRITPTPSCSLVVSQDDSSYARYVRSICFSPDRQFIATACRDRNIKLWRVNENQNSSTNEPFTWVKMAHKSSIDSICFSPDGKFIVTASDDKTAKIWEFDGQNIHQTPFKILEGHDKEVKSACFNFEGNIIATASADKTIKLWDLDGQEFLTLKGHSNWVQSVFFQPHANVLATASDDKTVRLWEIEKLQIQELQGHKKYVHKISFHPNLNVFATASDDKTVRLWKFESLENERQFSIEMLNSLEEFNAINVSVNDVCFHNNGNIVATASYDGNIRIWSFNDEGIQNPSLQTLERRHISEDIKPGDKYSVRCVCFNPDGNILASTGNDSIIKLWEFNGQRVQNNPFKELKNFILDNRSIFNCIRFSPNGKIIAAGSRDHTATLWNRDDDYSTPITLPGHTSWIRSISFNHDGTRIATASDDKTVKLWNLEGQELQTLRGHNDEVHDVSFNTDGTIIATASNDKTVKLWNLEGQELQTIDYGDIVECVSFIPVKGSNTIITSSRGHLLTLRELSPRLVKRSNAELGNLLEEGKKWIKNYSALDRNSWIKTYLEYSPGE